MDSTLRAACAAAMLLSAAPGCGNDGGGGPQLRANLGVDMAKITGFVVTQGAATERLRSAGGRSQGSGGGRRLRREPALRAERGREPLRRHRHRRRQHLVDIAPLAVFDTKTYVLIAYNGVWHGEDECNFVAAGKADGALYCVTAPNTAAAHVRAARARSTAPSSSPTRRGTSSRINHDSGVTLLDLTDPANVTQETPVGNDASSAERDARRPLRHGRQRRRRRPPRRPLQELGLHEGLLPQGRLLRA